MEKSLIKAIVVNYLKMLVKIKMSRFQGQIIGLGGCYGKSSAVNLLEVVIGQKYTVFTTNKDGKGLNSETGLPFALLGVKPDKYDPIDWIIYLIKAFFGTFTHLDYDVLILELGVDKPDDMKFLTSFIHPNVGIIINSNNTHSANFEELQLKTKKTFEELISFENGYIFERSKDAIYYNLDDPEVVRQISRFKGEQKVPFSLTNKSQISKFEPTLQGTEIEFLYKGESVKLNHPETLLEEYRSTFEMVIEVAEYFNLEEKELVEGLKSYTLPPSRCSLFEGVKSSWIIDSSYNSSYLPASSALKLANSLARQLNNSRTVAILGDMRELGVLAEKEHRKLAEDAARSVDIAITVGPLMQEFFQDEFKQSKKPPQKIYSFASTKEALELISKNDFEFIQPNDVILVKGSQNTLLLEIIVEKLLTDKSNVNKLCRRGEFYELERKKLVD